MRDTSTAKSLGREHFIKHGFEWCIFDERWNKRYFNLGEFVVIDVSFNHDCTGFNLVIRKDVINSRRLFMGNKDSVSAYEELKYILGDITEHGFLTIDEFNMFMDKIS